MGRPSPKKVPVIALTSIVSLVLGLVGNLLAGLFQQYAIDKNAVFTIIISLVIMIILGLIAGAWLEYRPVAIPLTRSSYLILAILATSLIVLTTALSFIYAALRPPTTYFLVDATEKMQPIFSQVSTEVALAPIPNSKIGLRVYGGNVTGLTGCDNTNQIVKPDLYKNSETEIKASLALVEPSGHSSLVGAVLSTLNDLAGHTEPVKLMIFTLGTDPECDPLKGGILQNIAGNIPSNINIVIVSIGKLQNQESEILKSYAIAFHGGYTNIDTPAEIPQAVQTISSYGSQDYLYPTPTP